MVALAAISGTKQRRKRGAIPTLLIHTATFAYDAAGRLASATDRLGRRRD